MTAAVIHVLASEGESGHQLPVPAWAIGVGAFALLVVALLVTMAFGKDR
jgi:hypothetical protein